MVKLNRIKVEFYSRKEGVKVNSKEAWEIFIKSGAIIDYLVYSKIKKYGKILLLTPFFALFF